MIFYFLSHDTNLKRLIKYNSLPLTELIILTKNEEFDFLILCLSHFQKILPRPSRGIEANKLMMFD